MLYRVCLITFFLLLSACGTSGHASAAKDSPYLYVCNQGVAKVSVIDMNTLAVVETVDLQKLGFTANAKPHHVAVEPDGSFWYLSLIGEHKVLKFNRKNELVGQVDFEVPGMLAVHPTQDQLFVGRSMSAVNPPQRIGLIRRSDMTLEEVDVFFPRPHALAVHPDGKHVFSASLAQNQIASIDIASETLELTTLDGPVHTLVQFAMARDGKTMVAGGQLSGKLLFFDVQNPEAIVLEETLDLKGAPWHPVFSPDGQVVYVPRKMANAVAVVNTKTRTVEAMIEGNGFAEPHGAAISPDGRYLFVSNNNLKGGYTAYEGGEDKAPGTVVVIDTKKRKIVKVIEVGAYATGIGTATPR